jgi:hypothetical protein
VRFETNSGSIGAVWQTDNVQGMPHMARTGSNGLDLYRRKGRGWVYAGTGRPQTTRTLAMLDTNSSRTMEEYLLYLPLYARTEELKIGVGQDAELRAANPRAAGDLPIVFYGTSITQGGCASRAGMCHVAILGRWLEKESINLGFSGSGRGELIMGNLVGDIPASIYVLEPLPNMTLEVMAENYRPFVRALRAKQPAAPIVLVEHLLFRGDERQNAELKRIYRELIEGGDTNVHLLPAETQLAGPEDGTVDGVHPTDLGYLRMAQAYEPVLRRLLQPSQ